MRAFFSPTPRRLRRPNHPNLFLLGFRSKLIPWLSSLFMQGRAGQGKGREGKAGKAGQGRAAQTRAGGGGALGYRQR